jgi:hypothetical protein
MVTGVFAKNSTGYVAMGPYRGGVQSNDQKAHCILANQDGMQAKHNIFAFPMQTLTL